VSKCADSLPLYRKAYRRAGVQVDDSTLGELFHRVAVATKPLAQRLLQLVAEKEIVLADETTQRVQNEGKTRTAWLWSFIARDEAEKEIISYVFSRSRSAETPVRVLGDTAGKLVADAYSGYNKVTVPGGRERAGCLAHLRRKFFEAQSTRPERRGARWTSSSRSTRSSAPRSTRISSARPSTSRCDTPRAAR
jgi:transposase